MTKHGHQRRAARADDKQARRTQQEMGHRERRQDKMAHRQRRWGRLTGSTDSEPGSPDGDAD